ncbi:MAG: Ni/Fe hydrogenase subunit alpha [Nitrospinae bacterium]|nr:Ni/Fe hydrogenase subunit alpha [Nitrospinota bacterium]
MKEKAMKIKVDALARVEGEGAMYVKVTGGKVASVKLTIYEPPRFFEAFLRGRAFTDAPDITARICGICPIAYQMSSVHAMESALGVKVEGQLRALRRLIYCGEWIESHILHIYMLHLPDFLGYQSAIHMAKDHRDAVELALKLKKVGNEIVQTLGGREIHPVNVRVGGFYRVPERKELEPLLEKLKWARDGAVQTVKFTGSLNFPEFEREYEYVSMRHPDEYPFNEGRLVSSKGIDIALNEYENHFEEEHVAHSNALRSFIKGRGAYFVGPMARYNLNFDRLPQVAQDAARQAGLGETVHNPFKSIVVRAVETLFAVEEAIRIIENYERPAKPHVELIPKAGSGCGCSEAPRGICWHRYRLDDKGIIQEAKIVPPTSQNQRIIEQDLADYTSKYLDLPEDKLTWQLEQAIRNYDPCISCATHFLKLKVERD